MAKRLADLLVYVNARKLVEKWVATLAEATARTLVDNFCDVEAKALHPKLANNLAVVERDLLGYTLVCVEPEA